MKTCSILEEIAEKGSDKSDIAGRVAAAPELVPELLTGLTDKRADVRFGCDKILGLLAERAPEVLYPHIESFITNVEHPNTILRWGAIAVLGRLAAVDEPRRIDALVPELLEPIAGPVLVTAVKCIEATARIALAKPEFTDRVV
ncbi:hypothetical protein HZA57_06420, partial [Candidatus Poribacteria bacterium]|nr:hypothetical protein [Candidatus Poribacteria bacterium]